MSPDQLRIERLESQVRQLQDQMEQIANALNLVQRTLQMLAEKQAPQGSLLQQAIRRMME